MKRVTLECVIRVQADVPAATEQGARAIAEAMVSARWRGRGYSIRHVSTEDIADAAPRLEWLLPDRPG